MNPIIEPELHRTCRGRNQRDCYPELREVIYDAAKACKKHMLAQNRACNGARKGRHQTRDAPKADNRNFFC
eukprot:1840593-Rhodomonas_salina.2